MSDFREFDDAYELDSYVLENREAMEKLLFNKLYDQFDHLKIPRGAYILGKKCVDSNGVICFHYDLLCKLWVVYISERGTISNPAFFSNFHNGAQYLMWELIHLTKRESVPVLKMDS